MSSFCDIEKMISIKGVSIQITPNYFSICRTGKSLCNFPNTLLNVKEKQIICPAHLFSKFFLLCDSQLPYVFLAPLRACLYDPVLLGYLAQ